VLGRLLDQCYLLPKGVDRLDSFLPVREGLAHSGPSLFAAIVMLNLLEVSLRPAHLAFVVAAATTCAAATTWVKSYPDGRQHGIGRRCGLAECGFRSRACSLRYPAARILTQADSWRWKLTRQQLSDVFALLPELLELGAYSGKVEVAGEVEVVFVENGHRLDKADLLQLNKPFLDVFLGVALQRRAHYHGMRAGAD